MAHPRVLGTSTAYIGIIPIKVTTEKLAQHKVGAMVEFESNKELYISQKATTSNWKQVMPCL